MHADTPAAATMAPRDLRVGPFALRGVPRIGQFAAVAGGVFVVYLYYGYVQERIFQLAGFRPYGWYLTLIQFVLYAAMAGAQLRWCGDAHDAALELVTPKPRARDVPWSLYCGISLLTVGTMGLSNTAVGYLNYPTQVVFKSCKLIPVMVGGILIQHKRYHVLDFVAAGMMSAGLAVFTLADVEVSPAYSTAGLIMIVGALACDAAIGNLQEKVMREHHVAAAEIVFFSYAMGSVVIFLGLLASGSLWPAIQFASDNAAHVYGWAVSFSVTGYVGVLLVLALVDGFGALVAVTVTTFRKAVSMALSFLMFPKPMTLDYLYAALLVFGGIGVHTIHKNRAAMKDIAAVRWAAQLVNGRETRDAHPALNV